MCKLVQGCYHYTRKVLRLAHIRRFLLADPYCTWYNSWCITTTWDLVLPYRHSAAYSNSNNSWLFYVEQMGTWGQSTLRRREAADLAWRLKTLMTCAMCPTATKGAHGNVDRQSSLNTPQDETSERLCHKGRRCYRRAIFPLVFVKYLPNL